MTRDLSKYGQYKRDIFKKMGVDFERGKKILDVGCGDCTDAEIFIKEFALETYGIDIYEHKNAAELENFKFKKGGIFNIPFENGIFDYVFLHDVLHHIDEENQDCEKHKQALRELGRVCKEGGKIIILEANRYNPIFYPHMVKMEGHNHWKQLYFKKIISEIFNDVEFRYFESHFYPWGLKFWRIYEFFMENIFPKNFLSYNLAIIKCNLK